MKAPYEGEWRFKNGNLYKAVLKKEWVIYVQKLCPVCGEAFRTKHFEAHTCSPKCRSKLRWKVIHEQTGFKKVVNGYVQIWIQNRLYPEHRHIMEQHIGRLLEKGECIHHINGNRSDNRLENLVLLTRGAHNSIHKKEEAMSRIREINGQFTHSPDKQ